MNRQTRFYPELRERAIRLDYEQRQHHELSLKKFILPLVFRFLQLNETCLDCQKTAPMLSISGNSSSALLIKRVVKIRVNE